MGQMIPAGASCRTLESALGQQNEKRVARPGDLGRYLKVRYVIEGHKIFKMLRPHMMNFLKHGNSREGSTANAATGRCRPAAGRLGEHIGNRVGGGVQSDRAGGVTS
jgi:hypothetical protein